MSESDTEPIRLRPRAAGRGHGPLDANARRNAELVTAFDRGELREILAVYGRKVAAGEWRDYAIDLSEDKAVFSVYRRASEYPLYRIEKTPRLARRQGAYSVVAAAGLIVKRGHDLSRVLRVLEGNLRLVEA